ncbi:MAG TPA: hypothetical protein VLL98_04585 [Rickettsiales bacterium]|nr:hypothetical protein [Rickettsiales bacterium]
MIKFKDIKHNFFTIYYKYWIIFFIILIICFINIYRNYNFKTDKIPNNIENAVYVGSGVAINNHNVVINKSLLDNICIGKHSNIMGKIFIINKQNTFQAILVKSNSILDIAVLGTKRNEDRLSSYALLNINNFDYKIDKTVIIPRTLNKGGYFDFKQGKILDSINSNFFISVNNTAKKNALLGMPVFNENYILLGIIKNIGNDFSNKINENNLLKKSNIQKIYFVNGVEPLKNFFDNIKIPYSIIDGNFNFGNKKYNIKDSIVDVICIKTY